VCVLINKPIDSLQTDSAFYDGFVRENVKTCFLFSKYLRQNKKILCGKQRDARELQVDHAWHIAHSEIKQDVAFVTQERRTVTREDYQVQKQLTTR
jgi:hypothetical protein